MALVPTNHLHPRTSIFMESLNSSLFKFPVTTRLQFLSYAYYATPFRNLSYYAVNSCTTISASIPHQNPPKGSTYYRVTKKKHLGLDKELAICNGQAMDLNKSRIPLLDRWNEIHKQEKLKGPQPVADYRNRSEISGTDYEESNTSSTMEKIVQKMKRVSNVDYAGEKKDNLDRLLEQNMSLIEEGNISRHGFSEKKSFGDDDNLFSSNGDARFPWEKPEVSAEEEEGYSVRLKSKTSLAESILPETELYRLRRLTYKANTKMKIGGAGVTHKLVEKIHEKWRGSEIVRLKVEGVPALNMKRVHETLERKTGGLVIWRSGTSISLYRGVGYKVQSEQSQKRTYNRNDVTYQSSLITTDTSRNRLSEIKTISTELVPQEGSEIKLKSEVKYEEEIENILHGLGPRYTDFPGPGPLPVDADLLPGVLPDYKAPFRILPYGVRSTLNSKEATALRRLAQVIPPHFALGRSRQHQGLAAAMVKLWERSSIAKIALKRGVQLTTSERMADDIKKLTGCTLLSRTKDILVFYRGKDFLSPDVAEALVEKERLGKAFQDEEEQARLRASALVAEDTSRREEPGTAGTLGETLEADARWGKRLDDEHKEKVMGDAEILRHANLVRKLERKVAFVERKIFRAERALSKVEQSLNPAEPSANPESITDDERYMFQKLGMRMKAFLLLGRRGVFDGTVENMHLHWKYRELVKIIVKAKNFEQAKNIAVSLEAESGGVLVSVNKISKGYAIIVFRGKDYMKPSTLRPKNLLTKRKALARSIELQRHEALVRNISTLQARYDQLRSEIEQMVKVEDHGDEELYNRIESAYSTEDEESEEERGDIHPEVFDKNDDLLVQSEEEEEGDDVYHEVYEKDDDLVDQGEEEDAGDDADPEDYKHGEDNRLLKQRRESMMNNHRLQTFSYEP